MFKRNQKVKKPTKWKKIVINPVSYNEYASGIYKESLKFNNTKDISIEKKWAIWITISPKDTNEQ